MAQSEGVKPKGQKNKKQMLVRYGRMGFLGWFTHNESKISKVNSRVVIKTRRGLELGDIVGQYNYRGGHFRSTPEQVEEYFGGKSRDYPLGEGGTFVRFATEQDLMEEKHLEVSAKEEAKCCEKFIKEMNLPMKVVDSEHLFGGERVVLYFSSNGRVDFRDLVRRLAREYQTRIELRQIGSRDEAKLISDFESCGQECCCRRFLKILEPVNMRMAKLQKATLDPSKISGHCGRLKCCLRYEDQTYKELKKCLPRRNCRVKTPKGEGKVSGVQILTQLVMVQDASGKREAFNVEDIEVIDEQTGAAPKRSEARREVGKKEAPVSDEGKSDAIAPVQAPVLDDEASAVTEPEVVVHEQVQEPEVVSADDDKPIEESEEAEKPKEPEKQEEGGGSGRNRNRNRNRKNKRRGRNRNSNRNNDGKGANSSNDKGNNSSSGENKQ